MVSSISGQCSDSIVLWLYYTRVSHFILPEVLKEKRTSELSISILSSLGSGATLCFIDCLL
jgi:hypothetical protein